MNSPFHLLGDSKQQAEEAWLHFRPTARTVATLLCDLRRGRPLSGPLPTSPGTCLLSLPALSWVWPHHPQPTHLSGSLGMLPGDPMAEGELGEPRFVGPSREGQGTWYPWK